ncbi:MAG: hypothetical protein U0269_20705 [Polyangiales bacterium]
MLVRPAALAVTAIAFALNACGGVYVRPPSDDGGDAGATLPTLRLAFDDTAPLQLQPMQTQTLRVRVTDTSGAPTPALVRWSLIGESSDATLVATQSRAQRTPDGSFVATVDLIGSSDSAVFNVRATTDDGAEALRSVSVSGRGFGVIRAGVRYDGVRGPSQFELALFGDARCESVRGARPLRSMTVAANGANPSVRFEGLAADLEFAVVAEGIGTSGERVSRGCIEAVRVVRDAEQSVTIRPDDLPLHANGTYTIRVQLGLDVVSRSGRALWLESAAVAQDPARAILFAIADAVERTSGAAARASFEADIESTLAAAVTDDLRRRAAMPNDRLAAWADSIAASMGGAVWTLDATASSVERGTTLSFDHVQLTADPRTPEDTSDDLSRDVDTLGSGTISVLAGDRAIVTIDRAALPVSALAALARDAHLARTSVSSTAERLRGEVRCNLLVPIVRASAGRCNDSCVIEACEALIDSWAQRFDASLTSATETLRTATLSFVGVARAQPGSVTVLSVAPSAVEGRFIDDPSRPVLGVGSLQLR